MVAIASPYVLRAPARPGALPALNVGGGADAREAGTAGEAAALRRAVTEGRFSLAFQPVVRLADRTPHHHAALLRVSPAIGLPPHLFLARAATAGLAADLAATLLGRAMSAVASGRMIRIAPVLAALQDPGFPARADAVLGPDARAARQLMIEVPAEAAATLAPVLAHLRRLGARLCLSGLGADPAALDAIRIVPCATVALDPALLTGAATPRGRRLLRALADLAEAAGAQALATGIETLPQTWALQDCGITLGQGFLFGAPGPLLPG